MDFNIEWLKLLVEFLGKALGTDTEVILHMINDDNMHNVVTIANGHISGRDIGAPLTDWALKMIENKEYVNKNYICNYSGKSKDNKIIQSSTLFIKDKDGNLIGLLCINQDKSKYVELSDEIIKLANIFGNEGIEFTKKGSSTHIHQKSHEENLSGSVNEVTACVLNEFIGVNHIPPERMTQEEKMKIVDKLNQRGVFMLKGAVPEVASQLHSSEATIYRYLGKLNRK